MSKKFVLNPATAKDYQNILNYIATLSNTITIIHSEITAEDGDGGQILVDCNNGEDDLQSIDLSSFDYFEA